MTQILTPLEMVRWLGDAALKSAVLLVAAWLLTLALRRSSASWRHLVWLLAAFGALVLPFLTPWLPAIGVSHLPTVAAVTTTISPVTPTTASPLSMLWPRWVLLGWGIGALLITLRWIPAYLRLGYLWRCASPTADGWQSLLVQTAVHLGIRRRVKLRISSQLGMPITWGAWRPVIVLPVSAEEWDEERCRLVLLHELAHVKRWDWLAHLPAQAACILYWYNPLAWLALRGMTRERERACDDLVLHAGYRASDYAEHLLALAHAGVRPVLAAGVAMALPSGFEARLRALLADTPRRHAVSRIAAISAAILLCVVLGPLAALRNGDKVKTGFDSAPTSPVDYVTTPALNDVIMPSPPETPVVTPRQHTPLTPLVHRQRVSAPTAAPVQTPVPVESTTVPPPAPVSTPVMQDNPAATGPQALSDSGPVGMPGGQMPDDHGPQQSVQQDLQAY